MSSKLINRNRRKKTKNNSTPKSKNLQKSKSANHLSIPVTEDDLYSTTGSDCSSPTDLPGSCRSRTGHRMSLDSGVSLECPSLSLAWEMKGRVNTESQAIKEPHCRIKKYVSLIKILGLISKLIYQLTYALQIRLAVA